MSDTVEPIPPKVLVADTETDVEQAKRLLKEQFDQENYGQRFHLHPKYRIPAILAVSGAFGLGAGFYNGYKAASLQYLAENAHRLPRSMSGWYFYHKRKNYVIITKGMINSVKYSTKVVLFAGGYFGLEALIDKLRGQIDFLSTMAATATAGALYSMGKGLSRTQVINMSKKGLAFGFCSGVAQDALRYLRNEKVWYVEYAKVLAGRISADSLN